MPQQKPPKSFNTRMTGTNTTNPILKDDDDELPAPKTVKDMLNLHNHTQRGWRSIEQGLQSGMDTLNEKFDIVTNDVKHLAGKVENELRDHDKRIAKTERLHEKLSVKVEEIEHLDQQRDNNIENLQRQFNTLSQEVRDEIKGIRDATETNRRERRDDIHKLEKQIKEGFVDAESQRKEENWNSVKQNAALISTVLAIIVPILVALIYLTTTAKGG